MRKLLLGLSIVLSTVWVGYGAFSLTSWLRQEASTDNTVTVGKATVTTITGKMEKDGLMPGEEISQEYTISITDSQEGATYCLEIFEIVDGTKKPELENQTWFEICAFKGTGPSDGKVFQSLAENKELMSDLEDRETITICLRLKAEAPPAIAGAELTFSLRVSVDET